MAAVQSWGDLWVVVWVAVAALVAQLTGQVAGARLDRAEIVLDSAHRHHAGLGHIGEPAASSPRATITWTGTSSTASRRSPPTEVRPRSRM